MYELEQIILDFLPFLIPLVLLQVGLTVASLVSAIRQKNFRRGNRVLWIIVSFISIIGPILYFTLGRGDE
ncbi:MAG: PLDc N-terminal domain-containing protein [Oscillospiraceae bacterium]|nr:PLDc N-terminal domain-containing protein [Oscillospiraceae bacterium]